jgi:hypothetical protein
LHSQTEWLRLSNVSIGTLPFVCLAAHEKSLYGGHTLQKSQTATASLRQSRGLLRARNFNLLNVLANYVRPVLVA